MEEQEKKEFIDYLQSEMFLSDRFRLDWKHAAHRICQEIINLDTGIEPDHFSDFSPKQILEYFVPILNKIYEEKNLKDKEIESLKLQNEKRLEKIKYLEFKIEHSRIKISFLQSNLDSYQKNTNSCDEKEYLEILNQLTQIHNNLFSEKPGMGWVQFGILMEKLAQKIRKEKE